MWIWKPSLSSAVARAWKSAGFRFALPRSSPNPMYGSSTAAVRVSRTPSAKIFTPSARRRLPRYFDRRAIRRGSSETPFSVFT